MVMIHTYARGQGQRSVGLKDGVEMGGDCITSRANVVGINNYFNVVYRMPST